MAENSRPPVAIRIVRPYESEDELLEHELETVGKTSVVLIGAHPRPTGVILRFEVTLASGATVLRGEGRVLAHKENAFRGQPGLTLRFTRLDPRSKAVVDRATAMRDARTQGDVSTPSRPAPRAEGALADALTASTPSPGPTADASATQASNPNAEQEAAVEQARAAAREKANAVARANAKRTGIGSGRPMALTPPPVPVIHEPVDTEPFEAAPAEHAEVQPIAPEPPTAQMQHVAEEQHVAPEDIEEHEDQQATPAPTPVTSVPGDVAEKPAAMLSGAPVTAPTISAPPLRSTRAAANSQRAAPANSQRAAAANSQRAAPAASVPAPGREGTTAPLEAPADRADLLARLRERATKLAPERIEEILSARR